VAQPRPLTIRRAILFRLAAILLGLSPFVLVELSLRAYGLGAPNLHDDPYVGFSNLRPLFERSAAGDRYEIAPSRRVHFFPDSFAASKRPDEFRIFCIGDSTVQGNPWEPETSFTTWLEISLHAADPTRQWNVINCGGISYASYRMVPILQEVLAYEPDLVILHCSHNEFLEDRTYDKLKRLPPSFWSLDREVSQLRLFNVVRTTFLPLLPNTHARKATLASSTINSQATSRSDGRTILSEEVQALLDYRGGLEFYHRDEAWHRGVIEHYAFDLRRMALLAREAKVPLILMNPACQLRDSPPFKAEHRFGLSETQRQQWEDLWNEARQHYAKESRQAVELLREALAIDDQHAGLHYDLAKCYDALGQFQEARAAYIQAKELDICPLRILESMNDIVREVGAETDTPVVDIRALFDQLSRNGIPGGEWFTDHVHPTIPGYQRIADELADKLVELGFVHPRADWLDQKSQRSDEHLNKLPASYFTRAQERLRNLMLWAHGRATKEHL
jgi:tetratricopeptide (TPR) repeat protein